MGATREALRRRVRTADRMPVVLLGATASATAGFVHAAAAGSHTAHVGLARGFIAFSIAQLAVALAVVLRPTSRPGLVGLGLVNLAAVGAWAVTRATGIAAIDGLGSAHTIGLADSVAGVLAVVAFVLSGIGLARARDNGIGDRDGSRAWAPRAVPLAGATALTLAFGAVALVDVASHTNDHDAHDGISTAAPSHAHQGSSDHAHGGGQSDADPVRAGDDGTEIHDHDTNGSATNGHDDRDRDADHADDRAVTDSDPAEHDHGSPAAPPRPYDPALPIDLGGVDGVTLEQQAFAENLVAVTLRYLPHWADPAVAEEAGFRSIGDGVTGHEHYVQWDWIDDDVWLDPTRPESLVFETRPDGTKELAAAMYMLPPSMGLDDIPDWGGELMQWHVHEDLCYTDDPVAPTVAAVIPIGASCPPGLVAKDPAPMIHVWIRPHECGPFAALDGIGAGQVRPGEEHACHHVHGSPIE